MPKLSLRAIAATAAVALFCSAGSAAADSPVVLGDFGSDPAVSNTLCTSFGYASGASHPYVIPYSGVITSFTSMVGSDHQAAPIGSETMSPKTVRPGTPAAGAVSGTVISSGTAVSSLALANGSMATFPTRLSAAAGDRLGIGKTQDAYSGYAGYSKCTMSTSGDGASNYGIYQGTGASLGNLPAGTSTSFADFTGHLPNIRALLEPDTDHDGYGDGSQDLCPDDAVHNVTSCSGTLVGLNTAAQMMSSVSFTTAQCLSINCVRVQHTLGGAVPVSPIDGVIVRWRAAAYQSTNFTLRVLRPTDATHYLYAGSSAPAAMPATPTVSAGAVPPTVVVSSTRLPIRAGDTIGLGMPMNSIGYITNAAGASSYADMLDQPDGATSGYISTTSGAGFFDADIEPDVDHDGYGDLTQDFCPSEAATQTTCPEPAITGFKFSPSRFRVNKKGAVISKRAKAGSTLKLSLSKPAHVSFVVNLKATGRRTSKGCVRTTAKNRRKKPCTYYPKSWHFERDLPAGATAIAFSGRMLKNHKKQSLPVGGYVVTAYPFDVAGQVGGSTVKTTMKVSR